MNKKLPVPIILMIAFILLAIIVYFVTNKLGFNIGYQSGKTFVDKTYINEPNEEFGELLDHTQYLINLEGHVSKINGDILELTKDNQTAKVTLSKNAVFVKGPEFKATTLTVAKKSDIQEGDRVFLTGYLTGDKTIISYQIFIYK